MRFHWRLLGVPLALATAALLPITAAASDFAVSTGSPTMTARTLITVPVSVSCSIDPSVASFIFDETVAVHIQQPAGRSYATADGSVTGFQNSNLIFACDGSTTTFTVSALANPAGPPFHGGPAIVQVSASVVAGTEAFPGCGCGPITYSNGATSTQQVTLH